MTAECSARNNDRGGMDDPIGGPPARRRRPKQPAGLRIFGRQAQSIRPRYIGVDRQQRRRRPHRRAPLSPFGEPHSTRPAMLLLGISRGLRRRLPRNGRLGDSSLARRVITSRGGITCTAVREWLERQFRMVKKLRKPAMLVVGELAWSCAASLLDGPLSRNSDQWAAGRS